MKIKQNIDFEDWVEYDELTPKKKEFISFLKRNNAYEKYLKIENNFNFNKYHLFWITDIIKNDKINHLYWFDIHRKWISYNLKDWWK